MRPEDPPSGYNERWGGVPSAPEASMSDKNPAPYVYAEAVPASAYAPRQHEPQYEMNHEDYIGSSTRAPAPNPASMSSMSYEDDGTGITPISSSYVPAAPKIKCAVQPNYYQGSNNAIIPKQAVAPSVNNIIMPSPAVNNIIMPPQPTMNTITNVVPAIIPKQAVAPSPYIMPPQPSVNNIIMSPQPAMNTITNAVAPQPTVAQPVTSNPPPGVRDGGVWGMVTYSGPKTYGIATTVTFISCLVILFPCGIWAFLCPCDKQSMYKVRGKVYDDKGKYIGKSSELKFVPM